MTAQPEVLVTIFVSVFPVRNPRCANSSVCKNGKKGLDNVSKSRRTISELYKQFSKSRKNFAVKYSVFRKCGIARKKIKA